MARTPASQSLPPFPALEWDGFSWSGKDLFPSWAGFQSRLGPYASVSKKKPSNGEAKVSVCAPGGGGDAPAEKADPETSQDKAYQSLKEHEEAVGGGVLVKHLRPARVGAPLHVTAKLVRVKGGRVFTRAEVHSRGRKLGEASVLQVVLTRSRFAKLLREAR